MVFPSYGYAPNLQPQAQWPTGKRRGLINNIFEPSRVHIFSLVTVIEIGTETAVFSQYDIEAKPRFYASLLTVLETEQL